MQGFSPIANRIATLSEQDPQKIEIIEYGLKVIWLNLTKTILLLGISALFGIFKYSLFMFCIYAILRMSAFGVHFKSNLVCTIVGVSVYLACVFLSLNIIIEDMLCAIIFIICCLIYAIYAPAQTEKRPIGPKQYKRFKIISFITVILFFGIAMLLKPGVYRNLIILPVSLEAICVLPVTFKVINKF